MLDWSLALRPLVWALLITRGATAVRASTKLCHACDVEGPDGIHGLADAERGASQHHARNGNERCAVKALVPVLTSLASVEDVISALPANARARLRWFAPDNFQSCINRLLLEPHSEELLVEVTRNAVRASIELADILVEVLQNEDVHLELADHTAADIEVLKRYMAPRGVDDLVEWSVRIVAALTPQLLEKLAGDPNALSVVTGTTEDDLEVIATMPGSPVRPQLLIMTLREAAAHGDPAGEKEELLALELYESSSNLLKMARFLGVEADPFAQESAPSRVSRARDALHRARTAVDDELVKAIRGERLGTW